ncbi:FAD-dependent oxidoreductase [Pseudomonas putida]|nr:FAD-dependent oxidoreductase [Pseudomonas putida]
MAEKIVQKYDVAIIGGGIIGSSIAYHLLQASPGMSVAVIEPDPTYEFASALKSSGGCRVQFTGTENIQMSLYSLERIRNFEHEMESKGRPAPVDWVEGGYLFVVEPEHVKALERNARIQEDHGCVVKLLDAAGLKNQFPSINSDDLGMGVLTPHDGWCDPNGLLQGYRRKAIELGAQYIKDRFVDAEASGGVARAITLESGARIEADAFVNAAGAWSGLVAERFDMALPIVPMRRFEHYFTPGTPMERLPYVKDLSRLAFRSEGEGFSGGLVNGNEPRGFNFEVDHDYWENVVWPAVAHRFPTLETAKCHRTWSGLYEVNELDGNAVIGRWNSGLTNLYTCAGFSGHGMMHAPAAGRGIAELMLKGSYQTIDMTRLGYERVERNEPYREEGIL